MKINRKKKEIKTKMRRPSGYINNW